MSQEENQVPCSKTETALMVGTILAGCAFWVALAVVAWMKWVSK